MTALVVNRADPVCADRFASWREDWLAEEWEASIPKQYRPWVPTKGRGTYMSKGPAAEYGAIIAAPPPAEMIASFLAAIRRAEHRDATKPTLGAGLRPLKRAA